MLKIKAITAETDQAQKNLGVIVEAKYASFVAENPRAEVVSVQTVGVSGGTNGAALLVISYNEEKKK